MSVALVTGSGGLVGSEAALYYGRTGRTVVGIDNDMRSRFFGAEASTNWNRLRVQRELGSSYLHYDEDIRDTDRIRQVFAKYGKSIDVVVHAAAQPSHDWAAREPATDFSVNAVGTLNLLEAARSHCPAAPFIFVSTNKVYGDRPNSLPLRELDSRWEIEPDHAYADGISEEMSIDATLHSLFGVSKASADLLVQEYGRYFDMHTACFRAGCLTGPSHSGTELHGFLAYLMRCVATGREYTVFGYRGKQVRDNIHSSDLIEAFECFRQAPRKAAVYNMGGGRFSNCSMLEAIRSSEEIAGRELDWTYSDQNRTGDHIWWISGLAHFQSDYPSWAPRYGIQEILKAIFEENADRWQRERSS